MRMIPPRGAGIYVIFAGGMMAIGVAASHLWIRQNTPRLFPMLTPAQVRNATYRSPTFAPHGVTLDNGRHEEPIPGSTLRRSIRLVTQVFGDLNGDGADDAAVVLVANGGGTGWFYFLNVLLNRRGNPVWTASFDELGDRTRVSSLVVRDGRIRVRAVMAGPNDPLCCPTMRVTRTFRLEEHRVVEEQTAEGRNP